MGIDQLQTMADYPRIPPELNVVMETTGELAGKCPFLQSLKDNGAGDAHQANVTKNHIREDRIPQFKQGNWGCIKDSILDCVGNTPMVRCKNIAEDEGFQADGVQLLAKCVFMNPGGAVKDRIGRRMIVDAEKRTELFKKGLGTGGDHSQGWDGREFKRGDVIIEPTSGNTGIGLSMAAAVKGYDMIITMPEKMSQEKQDALKGLGATIVRTPTEHAWDHQDSHISEAYKLRKKLNDEFAAKGSVKSAHVLDQYRNPGNGMAHYEETGAEIWSQTAGTITHLIAGAGTGGTITGIARKLKEMAAADIQSGKRTKQVTIVGVDPNGSILAEDPKAEGEQPDRAVYAYPQRVRAHKINEAHPSGPWGQQTEGIGYDFIPRVIDRDVVDERVKGPDEESFIMARRLLRREGFMCGGSSGTAMHAACQYIKDNNLSDDPNAVVVVVCPDNIRNYMTKHLNADWMYERGYMSEQRCADAFAAKHIEVNDWGKDKTVSDLPLHPARFLSTMETCDNAINIMRMTGFDQFPVKDENGAIFGVLTATNLLTRLGKKQLTINSPIKRACVRDLRKIYTTKSENPGGVSLNELVRILSRNSFVLVDNKYFITFSDIFDMMHPKPWMVTQEEFIAAQKVSTRNMVVAATMSASMAFVCGAILNRFWK